MAAGAIAARVEQARQQRRRERVEAAALAVGGDHLLGALPERRRQIAAEHRQQRRARPGRGGDRLRERAPCPASARSRGIAGSASARKVSMTTKSTLASGAPAPRSTISGSPQKRRPTLPCGDERDLVRAGVERLRDRDPGARSAPPSPCGCSRGAPSTSMTNSTAPPPGGSASDACSSPCVAVRHGEDVARRAGGETARASTRRPRACGSTPDRSAARAPSAGAIGCGVPYEATSASASASSTTRKSSSPREPGVGIDQLGRVGEGAPCRGQGRCRQRGLARVIDEAIGERVAGGARRRDRRAACRRRQRAAVGAACLPQPAMQRARRRRRARLIAAPRSRRAQVMPGRRSSSLELARSAPRVRMCGATSVRSSGSAARS